MTRATPFVSRPPKIAVQGRSGPAAPTHPRFPPSRGLHGAALRSGATLVVGDVAKDLRYLTTFGSTRSEIIVLVTDLVTGAIVGTLDVESERADAFTPADQAFLEERGRVALPFWRQPTRTA